MVLSVPFACAEPEASHQSFIYKTSGAACSIPVFHSCPTFQHTMPHTPPFEENHSPHTEERFSSDCWLVIPSRASPLPMLPLLKQIPRVYLPFPGPFLMKHPALLEQAIEMERATGFVCQGSPIAGRFVCADLLLVRWLFDS